MKSTLLVLGALLLSQPSPSPPSPYCPATVLTDYTVGIVYYAVVQRAATCTLGQVARVRKASTLNKGASYRPIFPLKGAWAITWDTNNIPDRAHWTLFSWQWEYWDGKVWQVAAAR